MKTKTPEQYLREPYSRILIPEEEGGYSAEILEFPGCFSQGDTAQEALSNLEEAAENWIEATLAQGRPIPEPTAEFAYSGKVALRLPRSLHRKAAQLAARDKMSLNTFIVEAVAEKVGARDFYAGVIHHIDKRLERLEQRVEKVTTAEVGSIVVGQNIQVSLPSQGQGLWSAIFGGISGLRVVPTPAGGEA